MTNDRSTQQKQSSFKVYTAGVLVVLGALGMVTALSFQKQSAIRSETKTRVAEVESGPRVRVVSVTRSPDKRSLSFVGEARPYATVTLYAKVSGYVSAINVDIGDKVVGNQLLAVIESPELDRQYEAAVADARSKQLDADRANTLLKSGSVSPQTAEHAEATAKVAQDTAAALLAQKDYELVRAPFAGTVTARYVDQGALVQNATTGQTTALPVVTVSQTDRLRVYVYSDQKNAGFIRVGDRAEISDSARPDVKLRGAVTRTSGELDLKTRTLLVETDVANLEGKILPGSFVQVTIWITDTPYVEIPVTALVMRGDKSFTAILTQDNKVTFRPISVYDSDGKKIRVQAGLNEGDRVILNVGDSIVEGQQVRPVEAQS